jgi:hypothetical protein
MRKIKMMFTVACAALLVTPAIAFAAPIAGPLPIAKVPDEIITINHLSEAHRGKHIRTRHVRIYPRPPSTPGIEGYASYPSRSRPGTGLVAPGDPGNPYLNSDFDRAVQSTQYNGR